jgi:hypothetical protein
MSPNKTKLRDMVESVLKDVEKSRNSDILLTIEIWKRYYPDHVLTTSKGINTGLFLESLYVLPREDNVKRIRAKIQNEENKYLPTMESVRKKRKISEDAWYDYLGYARRNPNQSELGGL